MLCKSDRALEGLKILLRYYLYVGRANAHSQVINMNETLNNSVILYKSSDLALVAAISLWYPVESIEHGPFNKAIFFFKRDENLDQLVELYWRGELKVNPLSYFQQLKLLKTRVYER